MKVKILFFGIAKDIVNQSSIDLELDKNITVKNMTDILIEKHTQFSSINDFSIAVNEVYVAKDMILKEGDVVAIIPPVSGG